MQPIRRLAGERAREDARRLAGRRDDAEQERERLAQLQGFRREYEQRFAISGQEGMDAHRLRDYNAFMARIDTAVRQQRQTVEAVEAEVDALREQWLKSWGDARALDTLVERYRGAERRREADREQRENDEFAQRVRRGGARDGGRN